MVTVHYFLRGQQKSCCYLHGMLVSDILADLAARNKLDDCGYLKEGVCRLLQKQKLEGGKNYVYEGFGMKGTVNSVSLQLYYQLILLQLL